MSRNSDRRKIKNVRNMLSGALDKVDALQTVYYKHVDEDPNQPEYIGWIAQDFAKVFPQLVERRAVDDGEGPIKDPVFAKPHPSRRERNPAGQGNNKPPRDPGRTGRGNDEEPDPEPEEPLEPDPVSEPVGGFTITSYEALIPVLTQAIKELHEKVKALEAKVKK